MKIANLYLYVLGTCTGKCQGCLANTSITREQAGVALNNLKCFLDSNPQIEYINNVILETGGVLESSSYDLLLEEKQTLTRLFRKCKTISVNTPYYGKWTTIKTVNFIDSMCTERNIILLAHPISYSGVSEGDETSLNQFYDKYVRTMLSYLRLSHELNSSGLYKALIMNTPIMLFDFDNKGVNLDFYLHTLNKNVEKINVIDGAGTGVLNLLFNQGVDNRMIEGVVVRLFRSLAKGIPTFQPSTSGNDEDMKYDSDYHTLNLIIDHTGTFRSVGANYVLGSPLSKLDTDYTNAQVKVENLDDSVDILNYCSACPHYQSCYELQYCYSMNEYWLRTGDCYIRDTLDNMYESKPAYDILSEARILELLDMYFTDEGMTKLMSLPHSTVSVMRDILTLYSPVYGTAKTLTYTNHIFIPIEVRDNITTEVLKKIAKLYYRRPYLFKSHLRIFRDESTGFYGEKQK